MEKRLSPEEAEVIFQEIIRKLPSVSTPAKLEELSLLALAMMLRRASSKDLRDELSHQIREIVSSVTPGHSPEAMRNAMRFAVRGCIKVLQVAKERRLPRDTHLDAETRSIGVEEHGHHAPTKPVDKFTGNPIIVGAVAIAVLLVLLGAYLGWSGKQDDGYDPNETTKFVEQMILASQGQAPATHMFGGTLEVSAMNGVPVVTARGIPRRICAASGMRLVKKGLLSINGDTPTRISSAIITELCNKDDGDATIMWAATK
ncbi:hypothetical protein [Magnetospirillum gryphiswaldense]|uniref:Uncharacterized protein n=1 Tax=Magnetospirillum gryphiswaldense TaxID=55518 RepID=A4TZ91_9PROT|nr:hypothetical protein [Magnetospirillum gryphiswaldense]AVM76243.1 hypothetical protein MSR1_37850 [Magnetospirillum gryphiswaldense MSR-1]AVM80146.1 hypothetical protein MSR1L_37850 [Magnetospirillum gryphiswaldense]CAM75948.1 conserved hypothetical protein [Magnetospirillum gryphiswaldense MSR-1]